MPRARRKDRGELGRTGRSGARDTSGSGASATARCDSRPAGSSPAALLPRVRGRPSSASGGVSPQRPMPVSTFTCTLPRNPPATSRSRRVRRRDADLEPLRLRRAPRLDRRRAGGSEPQARALRAARWPSSSVATPTRRRSAGERRPCAALGPVPVAVGLDHRPELRAPEQVREPSRVCGDRRLVDLDVQPGHRASSRPRGRSRSEAENVPCRAAALAAAAPCAAAAERERLRWLEAGCEQGPDDSGEHVAGAGGREPRNRGLDDSERLVRGGDERVGPFQEHGAARLA